MVHYGRPNYISSKLFSRRICLIINFFLTFAEHYLLPYNIMNKFYLSAVLLLSAIAAQAYDFDVDGIYYDITSQSEKTVAVTYAELEVETPTYAGNLVIPGSVQNNGTTYSVTEIGYEAFANCTSLTDLTIPETVTAFGEYAFQKCSGLTKFTLPKSVTTIGNGAFYGCTSITEFIVDSESQAFKAQDGVLYSKDGASIVCCPRLQEGEYTIPATVEQIEPYAFCECEKLTKITIPGSVKSIGRGAFAVCHSLTELNLPESVASIDINAFNNCSSLERITVAAGNNAFASQDGVLYNKELTTLVAYPAGREGEYTIPNSVTALEFRAFCDNAKLTAIVLPESLTSISELCFINCSSLQKAVLPDSLTSIEEAAFEYCSSLAEITLPKTLTTLGNYAFSWCSALKSITIPSGITALNEGVFCYNTSLTEINLPPTLTTIGQFTFFGCEALTDYVVPETVTTFEGYSSFAWCTSLKSIYFPDTITTLGIETVWKCTSLTDVHLPAHLTSITYGLLADCTALESIEIPQTVTSIGEFGFEGCTALKSLDLPAAVTEIGTNAFHECYSLDTLTSRNPVPPTVANSDAFDGCNISTVYVPQESVTAYKEAPVWCDLNIVGADLSGISGAAVDTPTSAPKCYDLKGMPVSSDTLTPGLYIIDGRKVLVK